MNFFSPWIILHIAFKEFWCLVFFKKNQGWHHTAEEHLSFLLSWPHHLNHSPPERWLLSTAAACHFWVSVWAKEWQHRARTHSDECQHSGCSLPARREANRQTAGSSQAWWGLLDRVQRSGEHLAATPCNSCSSAVGVLTLTFWKAPPMQFNVIWPC